MATRPPHTPVPTRIAKFAKPSTTLRVCVVVLWMEDVQFVDPLCPGLVIYVNVFRHCEKWTFLTFAKLTNLALRTLVCASEPEDDVPRKP